MKIIGANVTGSFILNSQDVTTTIQTSNVWSGSVATDITALNATTASLNRATASLLNYTSSTNAAISDILLETASFNAFSSSILNFTSSTNAAISDILLETASINLLTASLLSYTSSQNNRNGTYATTGSNTFTGIQTVNSNLVVTGSITAQTLIVQTITSSQDFVTGSTKFGALAINTHQFTGSVSVTGSLNATAFTGSGAGLTSIPNAALTNSTISGISLGSNLATLTIGTGLSGTSYNGSTAVTIANTGVTSNVAGTGITVSGATGAVTITNSGVTSIVAGTNISISGGTGAVTITNGVTNNNQLTNGAGYITSAGNAATATTSTNVASPDGDRNPSTKLPTTNARNVRFDFSGAGAVGGTGNYAGVMTYAPWDGTTASTGDSSYQLAFLNETGVNASGVPGLSIRNGIDSTWNSWYRILTSGNYSSYALPLSGGTLTGNLNITGGQGGGNTTAYSSAKRLIFDNDYTTTAKGPNKITLYDSGFLAGFGIHSSTVSYYSGDTHKWYKATTADNASIMMQLDGSGNFNATGDVTAYSDIRVKENILNIVDPLNTVLKLRGVSYNRIDTDDKTTKIGFIAQEIEKIVPEVVSYDELEDRYSVSYGNVTALLVEAIKEQQSQIEELKTLINGLTK